MYMMYVHMCVSICVYMCLCIEHILWIVWCVSLSMYTYVHACEYMYVHMYTIVNICLYTSVWVFVCTHLYEYLFVHMCVSISMYTCLYMCVYWVHTVRSKMLGGFIGYSGGNTMRPWYKPPSNSESAGPLIVKCHSNKLSWIE